MIGYRTVFLDRDGTLLKETAGRYVESVNDMQFETGALDGIRKLSKRFQKLIVVTNQAGVGKGIVPAWKVAMINDHIHQEVKLHRGRLDGFYVCPHLATDGCGCRKPGTLLFERAIAHHEVGVSGSYVVGDRISDLEAAARVGARPVLVRTGHGEQSLHELALYPEKYAMIYRSNPLVADNLFCFAFEDSLRYLKDFSPRHAAPTQTTL